jgi:CubicO group peptidase (beta-lactamase class C family)
MSPDRTIMNIGSVSKTITATAVLQLCEEGKLSLTQDVNSVLPFSLRSPFHPDTPITAWQLLVHRSSIKDGPEYGLSYGCGPSGHVLGEWLRTYLSPGGERFDANANFHGWAPGQGVIPSQPRSYSNVAFGVLGYLVELASGSPFPRYCDEHVFAPLGMRDTYWRLADAPAARHAVPHSLVDANFTLPDGWSPSDMLPAPGAPTNWPLPLGSQFPHCAYEFATYPDGGLRTTAQDLGKFLAAYVNGGQLGQARILREATVREILTDQELAGYSGGLGWEARREGPGRVLWGHGGSDPGIRAAMYFDPQQRIGVAILSNTSQNVVNGALDHVYEYCVEHQWPSEVWR